MDTALLPDMETEIDNTFPIKYRPYGEYYCTYCKALSHFRKCRDKVDHFYHVKSDPNCPRSNEIYFRNWGITEITEYFSSAIPINHIEIQYRFSSFFKRITNEAFSKDPKFAVWSIEYYFPSLFEKQKTRVISFLRVIEEKELFVESVAILELIRCKLRLDYKLIPANDIRSCALIINILKTLSRSKHSDSKTIEVLTRYVNGISSDILNKILLNIDYTSNCWYLVTQKLINTVSLELEPFYCKFVIEKVHRSKKVLSCYTGFILKYCKLNDKNGELEKVLLKHGIPDDCYDLINFFKGLTAKRLSGEKLQCESSNRWS